MTEPEANVNLADLVSAKEIADAFGVTRTAVYQWAGGGGFPRPVLVFGLNTRVWLMPEVRAWREANPRPVAEHGGAGTKYNAGCRCEECRAKHKVRMLALRADRTARLEKDPGLAPHGLASTYTNWGCRCDPCTLAHSAKCRAYALRRRAS